MHTHSGTFTCWYVYCVRPQWHIHLLVCVLCTSTVAHSPVGVCTMHNGSGILTCWCMCCQQVRVLHMSTVAHSPVGVCTAYVHSGTIHPLVCVLCTMAVAYSLVGVCAVNRYVYCICPQRHIHLLVCVCCMSTVAHSPVGVCVLHVHSGTFTCWCLWHTHLLVLGL